MYRPFIVRVESLRAYGTTSRILLEVHSANVQRPFVRSREDFVAAITRVATAFVNFQMLLQKPQGHEAGSANLAAVVIKVHAHMNH